MPPSEVPGRAVSEDAPASWSAAALCRFVLARESSALSPHRSQSARGLAHSTGSATPRRASVGAVCECARSKHRGSDPKIAGRGPKIEKAELLMTRANSGSGESDFELARLITGSTFPFLGTAKGMPGSTLPTQRSAGAIPESAPGQCRVSCCTGCNTTRRFFAAVGEQLAARPPDR